MNDLEQLQAESQQLSKAILINAGADPNKVQAAVKDFLEIIQKENLNHVEISEALNQVKNKMDYFLSRVSASAWVTAALQDAKE